MKSKILIAVVFLFAGLLATIADSQAAPGNSGPRGRIYVTSQGKFYETFATADPLPPEGPFQKLEVGPNGPQTEFGPGDPGYLGGRWWMDTNGNGEPDPEDHYFLCPLLNPDYATP